MAQSSTSAEESKIINNLNYEVYPNNEIIRCNDFCYEGECEFCSLFNEWNNYSHDFQYYKDCASIYQKNYPDKYYQKLSNQLIKRLPITRKDIIIDWGCGKGQLLKELKKRGITKIKGTDVNYFSIKYGKDNNNLKNELEYYNLNMLLQEKDYVFFIEMLEFLPEWELHLILHLSKNNLRKGIVAIINIFSSNYTIPNNISSEHKILNLHSKDWWICLFDLHGYDLNKELETTSYQNSNGIVTCVFKLRT